MFTNFRQSVQQFVDDNCLMMAASLAYYTLFAMPPLLFLLVTIISVGLATAVDSEAAERRAEGYLQQQAAQLIGDQAAAKEIGRIIANSEQRSGTWWKSLLSLLGIAIGATGVLNALQTALNHVWRVKPAGGKIAVRFLMKRLLSFAMILGFGFLLFVSFVVNTALALLSDYAAQRLGLQGSLPFVINQFVTFTTTWVFFTAIFRFMPDAKVSLKHAACGGLFTVALFTIGRFALAHYLSLTNPTEQLGAAASLLVILVWVYYSSIILLFGAEFTALVSHSVECPVDGAVAVREQVLDDEEPAESMS